MNSAPRIIASLISFSLLTACGLKGPLYLPPPDAAPTPTAAAKPKPPTAQPLPQ